MADFAKAADIREKTDEELAAFLTEKQDELFKLRFQHATGQLENTSRLHKVRKEIARAMTVRSERAQGDET